MSGMDNAQFDPDKALLKVKAALERASAAPADPPGVLAMWLSPREAAYQDAKAAAYDIAVWIKYGGLPPDWTILPKPLADEAMRNLTDDADPMGTHALIYVLNFGVAPCITT